MSSETTAAVITHNILTEVIEAEIGKAIYSESVMLPLMKVKDISGLGTKQAAFNFAPTSTAGAVTDGTALSNTSWIPTNATIAASEVGKAVTVTDLAAAAAVSDIVGEITDNLKGGLFEKFETDGIASPC